MIGHYLNGLTPEKEDRALTQVYGVGMSFSFSHRWPACLIMAVEGVNYLTSSLVGYRQPAQQRIPRFAKNAYYRITSLGFWYDELLRRFGQERVNAAIRNRILSNQARRVLRVAPEREMVPV